MKTFLLFGFFSICIAINAYSQIENPDARNLSKEERKELKKAKKEEEKRKREEELKKFERYVETRAWVVEAHTVFGKRGQSYQMDPTINFVGVSGETTTIQLSFNGILGWNGVGGITMDGKIGKYEYSNDGKAVILKMSAMGSRLGNVDIFLTISGNANGRATLSGSWGERIVFQGKFVSLDESRVYKGAPSY